MVDVYSIGEMVIDFIPGKEKASYVRNAGGAPANVAIAAARNGLNASMCCKVGNDDFGHFLMKTLKDNNVVPACGELCKEAVTTMAFVSLTENGERTFTFARKPGADMFLSEDDVKEADIDGAVIVHAGSCSLSADSAAAATRKAIHIGHEKGKIVSFDVNYRNLMWNNNQEACADAVQKLLPEIDILKISEEEVGMIGGKENLFSLMAEMDLKLIILTLGSEGADAYYDGKIYHVDGRKAEAVDATGAGDAFWGGFLSSLRIQGVEKAEEITPAVIKKAMEYGNISGFLCVQKKGAIASLPTREDVEKLMDKGDVKNE